MKSAIVAFLLLVALVVMAGAVSTSQERALSPIYKMIESLPDSASEMDERIREKSMDTLEKAKKAFEDKNFIVEIGIPHEEAEEVHTLMEKASIFLEAKEDAMFLTYVEEIRVRLKALQNYGKANLKNIT